MKTTTYAAPDSEGFAFTPENRAQAERIVARYPEGRQMSAVLALLGSMDIVFGEIDR